MLILLNVNNFSIKENLHLTMNICGYFVVGALEMQLLLLAFLYKQDKLLGRGRGRG